jgi:ATP-dependent helicase/nuclease subunit B
MNILLKSLADACQTHKITEKLLICPTLSTGHQLLESLARTGTSWLNLRPVTPFELAAETANPTLLKSKTTIPTTGQLHFLLEEILAEMEGRGELRYFADLQKNGALTRVLYPAISELRMAGITAANIDPASFVDPQKGHEIKTALAAWEEKLSKRNWADPAIVYTTAIIALQQPANTLYLILDDLLPEPLCLTFLQKLTHNRQIIIPQDPVHNLDNPAEPPFKTQNPPAESPLSYLFDPPNAPQRPDLEIIRAYGAANEIREVLRRIKNEAISLDQTMVCHTNSGKYIPLIFSIAARLNIPVTFTEGIPLTFTRPGRFTMQLLGWMEDKYASSLLYRLMTSGDMKLPNATTTARLLREAGVGWSRSRYISRVDALQKTFRHRAAAAQKEENESYACFLLEQVTHISALKELLDTIFSAIPEPDPTGAVEFPRLCKGLGQIISTYARITGETDILTLAALQDALIEAANAFAGTLPHKDALRRIRQSVESVQAGASPPKPGHLHVTGLGAASYTHRAVTFFVGLDAGSFPGAGLQDPVILDKERERLNAALPLQSQEPAKKLHRLALTLASRRGRLLLSFPSFDTVEGRPSSPAAILLQAYRLQSAKPTADYTSMMDALGEPAGFLPLEPSAALCAEEWWLAATLQNRYAHGAQTIGACFPDLSAGIMAADKREGSDFTVYDGRVDADPELDPRGGTLKLSATQFEYLANCPFAYYMRYVLRIQPPDEAAFDPGVWLDPLTRGSLLHDIYCQYLRETHDPQNPTPPDKERLKKIAMDAITKTKEELPPPSDIVYEHERDELLRGLDVFWRVEEDSQTIPAFFEVPFGFGQEAVEEAGLGLPDPVTVTLPDGTQIQIRGRIDRIDRIDHGTAASLYQVWDFKTGKPYGYEEHQRFKQGRHVQHALYAIAAEDILKAIDPEAKVEASGYLFPTDRGEGQSFGRLQGNKDLILELLAKGLDIVAAGTFCVTDEESRCTFCDYKIVCRAPESTRQVQHKKEHPDLDAWRRLQEYE